MTSKKNMNNLCGLVRTQNTSTYNITNLRVCSTDESESKSVHVKKIESKMININTCYTDKSESKGVHKMDIIVSTKSKRYKG